MFLSTDTMPANSHFAMVPKISRSRNSFGIAERRLHTMQFDMLYPVWWKEIYPGDTLAVTIGKLARLDTQVTTLYDDLYFDIHVWYCPNRLLQTNWARLQFNSQPEGPSQDNSSLTTPLIDLTTLGSGFASKSLYDYLGYATLVDGTSGRNLNNYLARMYNLVWNLNYRDQNLQNAATVDLDEGPDDPSNYVLLPRGKRHDRFSSSLPFQQKGTPPALPIGNTAPITWAWTAGDTIRDSTGNPVTWSTAGSAAVRPSTSGASPNEEVANITGGTTGFTSIDNHLNLTANLAAAVGGSLQALRQSLAIQHLLEADARGGTRDIESILQRWGVTVPDFRLSRPEWIAGQTFSFDGQIVPQTSETGTTPQANLAQFSQAMNFMKVTHSFVEHGWLMVLVSLRSNLTYQQGMPKEVTRVTRFDFYQPEFSNLGEVAVPNSEIYYQGTSADLETWGFQEYGYELRYGLNQVSSEFRSNYSTPRDQKHMADYYTTLPTLSAAWIESNTPIGRNIVVEPSVADPVEMNVFVTGTIARTLPMFSVPGLNRI